MGFFSSEPKVIESPTKDFMGQHLYHLDGIGANLFGSLSNVGVFTLRVFFGTNHSYGWCHSFCSKVEYVL